MRMSSGASDASVSYPHLIISVATWIPQSVSLVCCGRSARWWVQGVCGVQERRNGRRVSATRDEQ